MKRTITKILSIICLVTVLVCGYTMPCMKLTGDYQSLFGIFDTISASIPEEARASIEQLLETKDIQIDLGETFESLAKLLEPFKDGEIALMDFMTVSQSCAEVGKQLSALPAEGIENPFAGMEVPEEYKAMVQMYESVNSIIMTAAQFGAIIPLASYVLLVPVGLFGLFAFFVVLRIILRLFNRRGLGIGITFLAILNAALMLALPYVIQMLAGGQVAGVELTLGAEPTYVPYILVGGCLVSCILWAIGRGKKVKTEEVVVEVPVETPAAPVEDAPVVEAAVEETALVEEVVEEIPAEEVTAEEVVEETVEASTEETV